MRNIKLVAVLFFITLSSCQQSKVYDQFDKDFDENRWQKTDVRTYEFDITQGATNYNMDLHFAHIGGYQFASVPIDISIETPNGSIISNKISLAITDENGKDKGDCAGDICDLYANVFENLPLEVGKYKVKISHNFQGAFLQHILGLGIEVSAALD